ncbi:MAG: cyclase family protein [Phycisphaerae bacterium]|jgi:arylformamidase|nr:cyclase family protein [Phycisphaerae bacterium]
MIYDISTPLSASTPTYPGDPPVRIDRLSDVADGDEFTLSEITMSLHAGTHIDAPSHYIPGAPSIADIPLDILTGEATLADIPAPGPITPSVLENLSLPQTAARLLLRTPDSPDETALDRSAAQWLVDAGVKLIGIDSLSIGLSDQDAEVHRTLLAARVVIIESLNLTAPPPGQHHLICLPLNIPSAEASPARVILVDRRQVSHQG